MENAQYIIKDYTKNFLQKNRFRYSHYLSDYCDEIYSYKFPLLSHNKAATLECEISVSANTGIVNVNVYKAGTKELYPAYYNRYFGRYIIMKILDKKIGKKLKELGIEEIRKI